MTPKQRPKIFVQQLHKAALRSQTALTEAENDIIANVSERLESQADPLSPASAAAIARELMHI